MFAFACCRTRAARPTTPSTPTKAKKVVSFSDDDGSDARSVASTSSSTVSSSTASNSPVSSLGSTVSAAEEKVEDSVFDDFVLEDVAEEHPVVENLDVLADFYTNLSGADTVPPLFRNALTSIETDLAGSPRVPIAKAHLLEPTAALAVIANGFNALPVVLGVSTHSSLMRAVTETFKAVTDMVEPDETVPKINLLPPAVKVTPAPAPAPVVKATPPPAPAPAPVVKSAPAPVYSPAVSVTRHSVVTAPWADWAPVPQVPIPAPALPVFPVAAPPMPVPTPAPQPLPSTPVAPAMQYMKSPGGTKIHEALLLPNGKWRAACQSNIIGYEVLPGANFNGCSRCFH